LAAIKIANQVVNTIYHLSITCAAEGKLANLSQADSNSFLFLMPVRSNDSSFAMTGIFSCMILGALLIFDQTALEEKQKYVRVLNGLGNEAIDRENEIGKIVQMDFERVVYVGSGSLAGLTREAQLKILELTSWAFAMNQSRLLMKKQLYSVLLIIILTRVITTWMS